MTTVVRAAAVAGRFYPSRPNRLRADVDGYLGYGPAGDPPPKAIIAPHAGYVFSGPVAGSVYGQLVGADRITRVVLLGPAHTVPLRGMAITSADAWDTPLGRVTIDAERRDALAAAHRSVTVDDRPHRGEHCLEVHLPFLQETLGDFDLLPIIVGETEPDEVARMLDEVWGGDETLIVISTDLSHYLDHRTATARDTSTCDAIARLDAAAIHHGDACGYFPLRGFLLAARKHDLRLDLLDRRTSADTAGDPDRVVGYAAFRADPPRSGPEARHAVDRSGARNEGPSSELAPLLTIAAAAIAAALRGERPPPVHLPDGRLAEPGAAFVSLHRDGRLLGCIGTLEANRPLGVEVAHKAVAAAFDDPRLPPITVDDYVDMEIEVSVLTASVRLDVAGYDDLVASIGPGDGLTVLAPGHRATLLPVMWKQIPDPREFVAALWHKAGLAPRRWPRGIQVERYGSIEVTDPGPRARP